MSVINEFSADSLRVLVSDSRQAMGMLASEHAGERIRRILSEKDEINIIFAAAPSQNETLYYLTQQEGIDWTRVNAFHMDEYVGLPDNSPQSFGRYLDRHIFSLLPFRSVNYLHGDAKDPQEECERYARLLDDYPVDLVMLGIGENGHIAFNDPWVADFHDPVSVKLVPLDPVCRQQQVNDACFESLDQVPTHALTLTVPALTRAKHMICTVPAASKRNAVFRTVHDAVSAEIPASVMRLHPDALMFCDIESASCLSGGNQ